MAECPGPREFELLGISAGGGQGPVGLAEHLPQIHKLPEVPGLILSTSVGGLKVVSVSSREGS